MWVTRYIHRNPLDLAGVRSPEEYRWSSYRAYLGLRPVASFLDVRPVLDLVGGPQALAELTEDLSVRPSIEDVARLAECAVAVDDLVHPIGDPSGGHVARTVLVLLSARAADPVVRRCAADLLGHRSPGAARVARHRAVKRLQAEPVVARSLAWVEHELTPDRPPARSVTVGARHGP